MSQKVYFKGHTLKFESFLNLNQPRKFKMSQNLEVLISGAGITGIFAALHCHNRGISCEIHESRSLTGGILRDWSVNGEWYFRNCQYLTPGTDWFQLLPQGQLLKFPHAYGSFTDLWGETCAFLGFAGPVYSLKSLLGDLRETPAKSLSDRLNIYPEELAPALIEWVKRFGICPDKIHSSGAFGFQISRIFPLHFAEDIHSLKSNNKTADELYGLPREFFGLGPALAALPHVGFKKYFSEIEKKLAEEKIPLKLKSPVRADFLSQPSDSESGKHAAPAVVWTGNPIPLIRQAANHTLDAPSFKMRNIVMRWDNHQFRNPFYIQVFSKCHPITRIFVYLNKATIECFDDETKASDVVFSGLEILLPFLGKIETPEEVHEFSEKRHFLCSIDDYIYLEHFVANSIYSSLIPSPWHFYGRDSKIQKILNLLDKHFLN